MRSTILTVSILFAFLVSSGCTPRNNQSSISTPLAQIETIQVEPTPTVTMEPMAALVNGEGIFLTDFQAELARYNQALPDQAVAEGQSTPDLIVLNEMIALVLLEQGAEEKGFTVTEEAVQQKLDDLTNQMGGPEQLNTWLANNGYSNDGIKKSLRLGIASAWMRDEIARSVQTTADQVHIHQILLMAEGNAQSLLQQIQAGADFATLAEQYDPITRGDLGWFPRGYLVQPKVEEAAFTLQPGGVSDVIHTDAGYHIIQVIERDANHPLTPDAYATLQHAALQQWIQDRLQASQVETYIQ